MQIWRATDDVPADLGRTVVVIGNFDGVHLGHRRVVARARAVADERGLPVVAVTFDPHPMAVLRPDHAPTTLTTIVERAALLEQAGADAVLALPFTRDVAGWSPVEFVDRILVDLLHAAAVVVGANFRFGHRASGDVALLTEAGQERDFTDRGDPARRRSDGVVVHVRAHLPGRRRRRRCRRGPGPAGDRARRRGPRRPARPRAGLPDGQRAHRRRPRRHPADGVYAGWLRRLDTGERYPAAISVGTNPTFDGERERRVESYVLDRDDPDDWLELYDVEVEVEFVERLRGMVRFDSVEELVAQITDDVTRTRELLAA